MTDLPPAIPEAWPAAVLWDMDGTLVDTEPYWHEAEFELAAAFDAPWSEQHALFLVGHNLLDSGHYIRDVMSLPLEPEEIVDRLLDGVVSRVSRRVPWRPGAVELLAELNRTGVPCALVTMSYLRFVEPVLAALPPDSFAAVVTGDAVDRGKPHPEAYLTAAELLGVSPADCVAIEDSDTGATSAEAAGCTVLVVPHHVEVPPTPGRVFAPTLRDMTPGSLAGLRS
ncbi:MAG: HAD family phosphatase [Nocardioidaceae bacterium]